MEKITSRILCNPARLQGSFVLFLFPFSVFGGGICNSRYIVEALFEAGLKEEAVQLMKNYWGKMISLGADTYWEAFDPEKPEYSPYGSPIVNSYCHAWSCTPVYLIKKYLGQS